MSVSAVPQISFQRVLDALASAGCPARGGGGQYQSRCPAHDDTNPSLSITAADDRVLIRCHAGCDTDNILDALRLTRADLFDGKSDQNGTAPKIVATYDYHDTAGELIYQVVRFEPKTFRQRRPDGRNGWVWKLGDTKRVLYRLPHVKAAAQVGATVYVVEGEKDVHAIENAGGIATTNPGGAGKWRDEYALTLAGAHVVIVADRDDVGRNHAKAIEASLNGHARSIRLVEPVEGKDVADHLATGHTLEELVEPFRLAVVPDDPGHDVSNPIGYVDLVALLTRPRIPVTWHAKPVVAAGRATLLYSPGKTGKSLLAMEIAAALATGLPVLSTDWHDPVTVLYVDQEMTEEDWQDRLGDMGYKAGDAEDLAAHLHLAQLQPWLPMDTALGGALLHAEAVRVGAKVVVVDTASKITKGEENSNDTHRDFYQHALVPLKRSGIASLVLDHTGKDLEKGARGGTAKTDNVDLAFELLIRGRDLLSLRCSHARFRDEALLEPTLLRRQSEPLRHFVEEHARPVGQTAGSVRPTHLMDRVCRYVEANPGCSRNAIETAVKGKRDYVRLAVELLINEGYVTTNKGPHASTEHTVLSPFYEVEPADE